MKQMLKKSQMSSWIVLVPWCWYVSASDARQFLSFIDSYFVIIIQAWFLSMLCDLDNLATRLNSILKGRDTRCDKSLRHVAATGCCNKSPRVTCENHCRCDRILSLRSVAQIQTGLNLCDTSQRQTKRKRLFAATVQTRRLVAAICRIVCLGL